MFISTYGSKIPYQATQAGFQIDGRQNVIIANVILHMSEEGITVELVVEYFALVARVERPPFLLSTHFLFECVIVVLLL